MKKRIIALIAAGLMFSFGSLAIACEGPDCENYVDTDTKSEVGMSSIPYETTSHNPNGEDWTYTQGGIGWDAEAEARGSQSAIAHVDANGNVEARMAGAFQKEIGGGELSGAGAITITSVEASGYARGEDARDCNDGADYADVDLTVRGYAYQANGAYSDDMASYIGGWNESEVSFEAQTDNTDRGTNDQYRRVRTHYHNPPGPNNGHWHYRTIKIPDLTAASCDWLSATAITGGGTIVWAHNTKMSAEIAGVTANFGTACARGDEHLNVDVSGKGEIGGAAVLPGTGYAGFSAGFEYAGKNIGGGIAGGYSNVTVNNNTPGSLNVSATSTGFAATGTGGNSQGFVD